MKKIYAVLFFILSLCVLSCKNDSSSDDDNTTEKKEEQKISQELVSYQNVNDSYFDTVTETVVYTRNSNTKGVEGTWIYQRYEDYFDYTTATTRPVKVQQRTFTIGNPNWSLLESFTPAEGKKRTESTMGKYSLEKSGDDFIFSEIFSTGNVIKFKLYVSDKYMTIVRIN